MYATPIYKLSYKLKYLKAYSNIFITKKMRQHLYNFEKSSNFADAI